MLLVAGIATRRVEAGPALPYILEADWELTGQAGAVGPHDPLSSCYWPAAAPLAELLSSVVRPGDTFLELGCGTGLLSLTAAKYGAHSCLATDKSPASLELTAAAADQQGLGSIVRTQHFDIFADAPLPRADALLLSDVFVTEELAVAYAARVAEACSSSSSHFERIFIVDPGRSTRETFLDALGDFDAVAHDGFASTSECLARARAGERLVLLDTREGEPVDYAI